MSPFLIMSRRMALGIMAIFPWFFRIAQSADKDILEIPPARAFAWDISREGSVLSQEVAIREFDAYDILLAFGDIGASDGTGRLRDDKLRDTSWRKLFGEYRDSGWSGPLAAFLGGPGENYYRKSDGVLVVARTAEEVAQREAMRRRGELISRSAEPGTVIPVHLRVEKIGHKGVSESIFDAKVSTAGDEGGRMRMKQRFLAQGLRLAPGIYRFTAITLQDTEVPADIGVYLAIPLRDFKVSPPRR